MSIEFEDVTDLQQMVDAARALLKLPADSTTDQIYVTGFEIVLSQISSTYGKQDSAKANYLRMSVLQNIDLDGDNEETYHLAHRVGAAYLMHGWVAEAEETFNLALGGFNKLHKGEETQSTEILKVCGSLGTLYEKSGDYKKAIALASRLLKAQEEKSGPDHRDTLLSVVNVAGLLQHVGDLKQAEDMYRRAMTSLEKACLDEKRHFVNAQNKTEYTVL
jgi:tetratricopeptide (TPR) repeat protein